MLQNLNEIEGKGFEFPCEYPVKAMGPNTSEFSEKIVELVKQHAPEVSTDSVHCRISSAGKCQSVTVLVYALSKDHLISIYQDINSLEEVKWTL